MFDPTDAACANVPTEIFFYEGGNSASQQMAHQIAKSYCSDCPIAEPCLTWAVENKEEYGIWGGKTPNERRILRDRMRRGRNDKTMVIKLALQPKKKK
jgi:WhiB family redox-sensing transcriptional regulator